MDLMSALEPLIWVLTTVIGAYLWVFDFYYRNPIFSVVYFGTCIIVFLYLLRKEFFSKKKEDSE